MISNKDEYEKSKRKRDVLTKELEQEEADLDMLGLSASKLAKRKADPTSRYARLKKEIGKLDKKIEDYERDNPQGNETDNS